jgi:hypothetical protein
MSTATVSPFMLTRLIELIRQYTDEPAAKAKYKDDDCLAHAEAAFQSILMELNGASDNPLLVRHTITVQTGISSYLLPPSVEQIRQVGIRNEEGVLQAVIDPRPSGSFYGPGFRLEGRVLRFDSPPRLSADLDLELLYVPNGDFRLHYGTVEGGTAAVIDKDGLPFSESPTCGVLDTRDNAYVGAVLRIIESNQNLVQERTIIAYDHLTRRATVDPPFDPVPTGPVRYEVVPSYYRLIETVVAIHVALSLRAILGDKRKYELLERQYLRVLRTLRMQVARMDPNRGDTYRHDRRPRAISGSYRRYT